MAGQSISTTIHTTKLKNIYMVWEIEKSRSIASIQRNSWPIAQATAKKSLILLKSNRKNTFIHSLYKWYIDAQDPPSHNIIIRTKALSVLQWGRNLTTKHSKESLLRELLDHEHVPNFQESIETLPPGFIQGLPLKKFTQHSFQILSCVSNVLLGILPTLN